MGVVFIADENLTIQAEMFMEYFKLLVMSASLAPYC